MGSAALRHLRKTLLAAQERDFDPRAAPAAQVAKVSQRPGTASAPNLKKVAPNAAQTQKADDGTWLGMWVSQRLSNLQLDEDAARNRFAEGRLKPPSESFDPMTWGCEQTCEWLANTARAPPHVVAELREQGLRGVELITLDDADLCAMGCPIAERRRVLRALRTLRMRTPTVHDAAIAERRPEPGASELALHLRERRERLSVLQECVGKALTYLGPNVPLKTRRLLGVLFQQTEAVGLEALAHVERDHATRRRHDEQVLERQRRRTRNRVEPLLAALALVEDRLVESERLVEIERAKLQSMRDAMMGESDTLGTANAKGRGDANGGDDDGIDWRKLEMQDFVAHEVPSNLGERLLKVGDSFKTMLADAERDGGQAKAMLREGSIMLTSLERAEALASAQLAASSVHGDDHAKGKAAKRASVSVTLPPNNSDVEADETDEVVEPTTSDGVA